MRWIVDRIEDKVAVLEQEQSGEIKEIELGLLPSPLHEGAILIQKNETYILDEEAFFDKKRKIAEQFLRLRKKDS